MASYGREKLIELVKRLEIATQRGIIEWDGTDRPTAYLYSAPSSSVIVASVDNDGQIPYEFQLLNETGTVIESMISHSGSAFDESLTREKGWQELGDLYERVRRSATGVDDKIDELLARLPPLSDEYEDGPF